jgi:hypothetical protein
MSSKSPLHGPPFAPLLTALLFVVSCGAFSTKIESPENRLVEFVSLDSDGPKSMDSVWEFICSNLRVDFMTNGGARLATVSVAISGAPVEHPRGQSRAGLSGLNYPGEVSADGRSVKLLYLRRVSSEDLVAAKVTESVYVFEMVRESGSWRVCGAHEATAAEIASAKDRQSRIEARST